MHDRENLYYLFTWFYFKLLRPRTSYRDLDFIVEKSKAAVTNLLTNECLIQEREAKTKQALSNNETGDVMIEMSNTIRLKF